MNRIPILRRSACPPPPWPGLARVVRLLVPAIALVVMPVPRLQAWDRLANIEHELERQGGVEHIPYQNVAAQIAGDAGSILLFDVREQQEFDVSHLPGAIRLPPESSADSFLNQFGDRLPGHTVVFYCSTGRRSTLLAEAVQQALREQQLDLPAPANLKGGIFRWHNAAQPLVNANGTTNRIHPYNWTWRLFLQRKDEISYTP